jgi:hypothetical protein
LWQTIEQASAYAASLGDDIWIVDCGGIPLEFGGQFSIAPGERWTPDPISRERLRGRHAVVGVSTTAQSRLAYARIALMLDRPR